jgi:negative regulator of sigma E activity
MPATTYEYRFSDPEFVSVWSRWQTARAAWRKAFEKVDFKALKEGVAEPDVALIPEGPARAAAVEFLAARAAYKAMLAEYPEDEG